MIHKLRQTRNTFIRLPCVFGRLERHPGAFPIKSIIFCGVPKRKSRIVPHNEAPRVMEFGSEKTAGFLFND
ncbi:MAG: hypothetical protein BECKG1743D_GA0114223_112132 [Candidatus Kentron sp. G]|nr:MAG: hypothetical protein BECKG1743D_GA0114223_112132 [Candidatus Kentron sp. G]